jgi:hypothetical protein
VEHNSEWGFRMATGTVCQGTHDAKSAETPAEPAVIMGCFSMQLLSQAGDEAGEQHNTYRKSVLHALTPPASMQMTF